MESQQEEELNMSLNGGKIINNNNNNNINTSNNNNNNNNYLCRQSSTRWTPTTEQIKLLKELYYINGVRSPSADQIQSICARLRRYGKIEGKNVFYWFQNHKARERQKKRLTPTSPTPITTTNNVGRNNFVRNNNNAALSWKQDHQDITLHANKFPCTINNPGVSCSSSSNGHVIPGGGQLMGGFGYGAVNMENKFRDCSISGGNFNGGNHHVKQWTGVGGNYSQYAAAAASYSNLLDKISNIDEDPYIDQHHYGAEAEAEAPQIQTLPLFPMHNEHLDHDLDLDHGFYHPIKPPSDGYYTGGYRWSNGSGGNTSLELSLNSYGYGYYSQNL